MNWYPILEMWQSGLMQRSWKPPRVCSPPWVRISQPPPYFKTADFSAVFCYSRYACLKISTGCAFLFGAPAMQPIFYKLHSLTIDKPPASGRFLAVCSTFFRLFYIAAWIRLFLWQTKPAEAGWSVAYWRCLNQVFYVGQNGVECLFLQIEQKVELARV